MSLAQAQADLDVVAARLAEEHRDTNAGMRPTVVPFTEPFADDWVKRLLSALLGGVVFVLLIACANVANLLLSRSARRVREMSLRVSLGASRGRLVRQLLVETLLLTGLAGLVGVAFSGLAVRLVTMQLGTAPYWIDYSMDGRVLGLVVATCVATGLACGLVPALQVSKTNVNERLKDGGRAGGVAGGSHCWTTGLLTAEVALTLILLTGAGLMGRSFLTLQAETSVVDAAGLTQMSLTDAPEPVVYYPFRGDSGFFARLSVRGAAGAGVTAAIREEIRRLNPDLPLFDPLPLEEAMARSGLMQRSLGYSVAQRTQEIGVRMALGATAGQVIGFLVRRNAVPLELGLLTGLVGATALGRALEAFLVGVEAVDGITFLFVVALLSGVAFAASLVPARRAARIDPLDALRCE